LRNKVLGVN